AGGRLPRPEGCRRGLRGGGRGLGLSRAGGRRGTAERQQEQRSWGMESGCGPVMGRRRVRLQFAPPGGGGRRQGGGSAPRCWRRRRKRRGGDTVPASASGDHKRERGRRASPQRRPRGLSTSGVAVQRVGAQCPSRTQVPPR